MVRNSSVFAQASAVLASVTLALLASGGFAPAHAQSRVTGPVESSAMVSLPGSVHPWARTQFDRGAAPADSAGHLLVVLKRTPEQEAALRQLLADQKDPKSANYHKWMTPDQFAREFGVSDSDLQSVTGYLASQGMRVNRVSGGHMAIDVEATAGQIQSAFQTSIHAYSIAGKTYYANSTAPKIPAALSSVVSGFAAMNSFRVAGGAGAGAQAAFDPASHQLHPLYSNTGTSPTTYGVSPADLQKIYNIPSASGLGLGGKNVKVGVVGDSDINVAYVNNYRSLFGLGANAPTVVVDGNDPGMNDDAAIAYKQIELISAVAPNAQIYYYTSATTDYDLGMYFALLRAVDDDTVQVLVNGYQACETAIGGAQSFVSLMAEQAAAEGMTFVAASGNTGAAGCAIPSTPGSLAGATYAINGYASSSYLTAVGGTDFYYGSSAMSTYWGPNSGYSSAKSYIPEQVWNDSYSGNGNTNATGGDSVQLASGGGVSTAGQDGVSTPQPMPSYQLGNAKANSIGGGYARVIPDVSFFAGSGANNSEGYNSTAYLFCMQSSDCTGGSPLFTYGGGTEASSAVFAGAVALAVAQYNSGSPYGLGNINPELYAELGSTIVSHDITRGTNELACSSGPNCSGGSNMTGFAAGTGYDAATGLGSFDINSFVTNYRPINTTASQVSLTVIDPATGSAPVCVSGGTTTPACTNHGTSLTFNTVAKAASGGGTPSGDVAVLITSPLAAESNFTTLTLSGGKGTTTLNTLPGGTYNIYARYAGDNTYAPSVSATPYTITVKPEACQMVLYGHNVNTGSSTNIPYGAPVSITVEPYSAAWTGKVGIPSGSISVTDNGAALTVLPVNSEGAVTFSSSRLPVGAHSLNLTFGGDASFSSCSIGPFLANVTSAATVTTINPSSANLNSGSMTLTAEVEAAPLVVGGTTYPSTGIPPSGTIQFRDGNGNVLGTGTLLSGFDANGNAMGAASITLGSIPAGGTLTAVYMGDSHYGSSTSNVVPISSSSSIVAFNFSTTASFTITDSDGVTGNVYPPQDSLTLNISVPNGIYYVLGFIPLSLPANGGTVSILANGVTIASGIALDGNGNATYTLPQHNGYLDLPSGSVQLTVVYSGYSASFNVPIIGNVVWLAMSAASSTQQITINSDTTGGDFSLQSATTVNQASPLLASAGVTQANYTLQLTSLYNYAGNVSLACSVTGYSVGGVRSAPPAGLACSLSSGSVALSSGFGTSTLTVKAAGGYGIASNTTPAPAARWWMAAGGTTLACLFLFGLPGERRRWQSMLGVAVLAMISFGISGCGATFGSGSTANSQVAGQPNGGAGSMGGQATPTVPAGTYTVTVTGTATLANGTTIVHTLPVKVLVGTTN